MEWSTLLMHLMLVIVVALAAIGFYDVARTFRQLQSSSPYLSPTARRYLDHRWQEHHKRIGREADEWAKAQERTT